MNKIKGCYPLSVKRVVFDDGLILDDKVVMFLGDFLLVDEESGAPSMYNTKDIKRLEKVEELRPTTKSVVW